MPQLDNFSAWISIDDQPLTEYDVQYSEDMLTVECWIASEAGRPFAISWRDSVRSQVSMGRTFVDGIKCGVSKGINRRGYKKDPNKENDTAHQRGVPTPLGKERQLLFSKVAYTGEEGQVHWDRVGEIRLEISYVEKRGSTTLPINSFQAEGRVDENSKQMTPHCTRHGKSVKGNTKPVHSVKARGKTRVFVFYYRPLEVLKAIGIPQVGHKAMPSSSQSLRLAEVKQENRDHGKEGLSWGGAIKTERGCQKLKKEEDTDVKMEVIQFKIEDNTVKTEKKEV